MADYYPLIARAVAGLDENTGEHRRVLYERARTALVAQLRGVEPALDEADITRERLALEEAIRKIEAEAPQAPPPVTDDADKDVQPRGSLRDAGLRDFRDTMAEAEGLGEATAEANRSARETYKAVPGDRKPPVSRAPSPEQAKAAGPASHAQELHNFEPPFEAAAAAAGVGELDATHADDFTAAELDADSRAEPPLYEDDDDRAYPPVRSYGRMIAIAVLVLVVAAIAAVGYWQRDSIGSMVASLKSSETPASQPQQAPPPAGTPKITDRVGSSENAGSTPNKSANAPAAAVAQKVVLYEEDSNNPQGKRYVGSAIWRTETVSPGPGLAPELAIRADVEIPERHMRMTWSLRRNTDKALPASHTIEIMFTLPADFDQGGIANVPGVLMKTSEQARGVPLAGLAVKVTNGYFLIGLSAVEIDVKRNAELLKERDWFDIPIVYTSGKRAILAMEKGTPGQRAFEEAFRAWGQ